MPKKKAPSNINTTEMTEAQANRKFDKEAKEIAKKVKNSTKTISMMIPIDPENPEQKSLSVHLNGAKFLIPRGKRTDVPVEIADILTESGY